MRPGAWPTSARRMRSAAATRGTVSASARSPRSAGSPAESMTDDEPFEVVLECDERLGDPARFLRVRRLHLHHRYRDGSRSRSYACDFVERPKGNDAVVV